MLPIDWDQLRAQAHQASTRAYAPYSSYRVGAAGVDEQGRVFTGCNVENASYGLTLCAECGLIQALKLAGGSALRAVVCVNAAGQAITPCGRCRQLLREHGSPELLVLTGSGIRSIDELLPDAFGPDYLTAGE